MFQEKQPGIVQKDEGKMNRNGNLFRIKPAVDIYETQNELVVLAEMPNVSGKNLKVEVEDGELHIQGKRENRKMEGSYLIRETRDILYERVFSLEDDLDPEKITAQYQNGILKIIISKKEKAKPKSIKIN